MLHRFAQFEIDEGARELRAGTNVLRMQPRVFDLLVYLIRNGDRVVPKDELLEKVWPGVLVTDASLQRAVSLARTSGGLSRVVPSAPGGGAGGEGQTAGGEKEVRATQPLR